MTATEEEFTAWLSSMQPVLDQRPYSHPAAYALGMATMSGDKCIEVKFFPSAVNVGRENQMTLAIIARVLSDNGVQLDASGSTTLLEEPIILEVLAAYPDKLVASASPTSHGNVWALKMMMQSLSFEEDEFLYERTRRPVLHISQSLTDAPTSLPEVYLRLMAQSLRKTMPLDTSVVLPSAFGLLETVVWTSVGVFTLDEYDQLSGECMAEGLGEVPIILQDKLPRMLDYVRPRGVRIADGNRVRLGARLAEGTTVMHEGFANFNAVTLGECMIEGRIAAGVTIGVGSDLGGGVSIIGTMSGGGSVRVSVGEYCLLEAECILGIPIGDRVRVEAGLPLKATTPVRIVKVDKVWAKRQTNVKVGNLLRQCGYDKEPTVKASELAGINDAVFRRNAANGQIEVISRADGMWGKLNEVLHAN